MQTRADKASENKTYSSNTTSSKGEGQGAFQFADNRSEAVAQRKVLGMANNYSQQLGTNQSVVQRVVVQAGAPTATPVVPEIRTSTNFETNHLSTADVTDTTARTKFATRKAANTGLTSSTLIKSSAFTTKVSENLDRIRTAAANDTVANYTGFSAAEARKANERGSWHAPEIDIKARVMNPNLIEIHHLHDSEGVLTMAPGVSWGRRLTFGPSLTTTGGPSSVTKTSGALPGPPKPTGGTVVPAKRGGAPPTRVTTPSTPGSVTTVP